MSTRNNALTAINSFSYTQFIGYLAIHLTEEEFETITTIKPLYDVGEYLVFNEHSYESYILSLRKFIFELGKHQVYHSAKAYLPESFAFSEKPILAVDVKELRERTGAGMMDCKKVLTQFNADIDFAEAYLNAASSAVLVRGNRERWNYNRAKNQLQRPPFIF